jgi:hypothetical protein
MEALTLCAVVWWIYLLPLIPVAGSVWYFGRRRVQWNGWDFAIVLLPVVVWIGATMVNSDYKTLANCAEALALGCMAPLAPIVRVIVGQRGSQRWLAIGLLMGVCVVAAGLSAFVPLLPE